MFLPRFTRILTAFSVALLFTSSLFAKTNFKKGGWEDITQEELDSSAPQIDPNADCEFLYRELKVVDTQAERTNFHYYNRAKIYTEAGVEEWSKVDIAYQTGWYIRDLKARVIYPDETIVELDRKDIYKREVFKDERFEGFAKSFSFPGLKPGCIVEYKWTQVRKYWLPGLEVPLRAEWPTWQFDLTISPYRGLVSNMQFYNAAAKWEKISQGYFLSLKHQPAISEKTHLGARKNFEPFVALIYATRMDQIDPEEYWGYRGGSLVSLNKSFVRAKNREIKKLAESLFEGKTTFDEKLKAAYDYCASEIVNISEYTDVYTEEEIEDLPNNDTPGETIRNGFGTRYDINGVFASLCAQAGFEAYLAQVEDHREFKFNKLALGGFNLSNWLVAIRDNKTWRYFDPGSSFLPFETLNPNNVGANLIVADKKYYYMEETDDVDASFSQSRRLAKITLNDFGDLEAKITTLYQGYSGLWRKRMFMAMTDQEKEDYVLENSWKARLPRAEIEDFKIVNGDSREKGLLIKYTLKIPAYADVLGNRIIFNPCLFEQGSTNPFTDAERTEPMAWDFLPQVIDKVEIKIPEGFLAEGLDTANGDFESELLIRRSMTSFDEESNEYVFQRFYELKLKSVYGHNYEFVRQNFQYLQEADSRVLSFSKDQAASNE